MAAFTAKVLFLLTAGFVRCSLAAVILKTGNYSLDPLPAMPADFGPRIPNDGVEGLLLVAEPEDACTPVEVPVENHGADWVALIVRSQGVHSNCTFDIKVSNAAQAGAVAAIIYDDVYEALIIMSKPRGHADPGIPAVFVSQKSGVIMKKLMTQGITVARIVPITDAIWMSMLMSAFAGVLAVSVVVATFYFIRRHRIRAFPRGLGYSVIHGGDEGMTAAEMRSLPVVIHEALHPAHHRRRRLAAPDGSSEEGSPAGSEEGSGSPLGPKGGGTLRTCAICIEDYRDGEKLRVLPCKHRFHLECIDQWLSSRKPLCPICKWDALKPFPLPGPEQEAEDADAVASALPEQPFFRLGRRRWALWRWSRPRGIEPLLGDAGGRAEAAGSSQAADSGANTPSNFPGMHFARRASRLERLANRERASLEAQAGEIRPADEDEDESAATVLDIDDMDEETSDLPEATEPLHGVLGGSEAEGPQVVQAVPDYSQMVDVEQQLPRVRTSR